MSIPNDPPLSPDNIAAQMQWYLWRMKVQTAERVKIWTTWVTSTPQTMHETWILSAILLDTEEMDCWGLNSGTMLATTYAAMFPDRVGRIVLDGIFKEKCIANEVHMTLNNGWVLLAMRWISVSTLSKIFSVSSVYLQATALRRR